jgi:hypothetical protein
MRDREERPILNSVKRPSPMRDREERPILNSAGEIQRTLMDAEIEGSLVTVTGDMKAVGGHIEVRKGLATTFRPQYDNLDG